MPNITTFNSILNTQLMSNIELYKNNPSAIQRTILNYLQNVTNGQVDIIDPTNPFVFLLEAATVTSAAAVNEVNTLTAKLYPKLAASMDDLYLHMSDVDYVGIFSTPSYATFTMAFNKDVLKQIAVNIPGTNTSKVTIPRNSSFTINQYTFTMEYPIDITFYETGDMLISWDASITSPIRTIGSYIIDFNTLVGPDSSNWVTFNVDIDQISVSTTQFSTSVSEYFSETINYTDSYYYSRVYYQSNTTNEQWVEIKTTYTDQVFDPLTPTALIKVYPGYINVFIPQIYTGTNAISGTVRVDLYNTLGQIDVNLSNYPASSFTSVFKAIDQIRDVTPYTNALQDAQYAIYSTDVVSGGQDGLDINTLRNNVIDNSTGERILPITNTQISAYMQYEGYDVIKNVDLITNREFIAARSLPLSSDEFNVPSILSSTQTVVLSGTNFATDTAVYKNLNNFVITPESMFVNNSGVVTLLSDSDKNTLFNSDNYTLVTSFNSNQYLYTPFYYMVDTTSVTFDVRVFDMDYPKTNNLSYLSNNSTTGYKVSTKSYSIVKNKNTYTMTIVSTADKDYQSLDDSLVSCQMMFIPENQTTYAYRNGTLSAKDSDGNRIYTFDFTTNYNFDENNTIDITTFAYANVGSILPRSNLTQEFEILYIVNQKPAGYLVDDAQNKLNKVMAGKNAVVVTNESLSIQFGSHLENLWTRSRSIAGVNNYLKYDKDIPLVYTEDMFLKDPLTGGKITVGVNCTASYQQIAKIGDPVYNSDGSLMYAHRAGETVLNANGDPIILNSGNTIFTFDMVFYDGVYKATTDSPTIAYKNLATESMVDWVVNDIPRISQNLLEQSIMYFYPRNTSYQVNANINGLSNRPILSKQSVSVVAYLTALNYKNANLKEAIIQNIASTVREYLTNTTLSKTEFLSILRDNLTDVVSVSVDNFLENNELVILENIKDRLMLKRVVYLKPDNTISIKEDLTVTFINIESQ